MPVNAKFTADFTNFQAAVEKAQGSLKGLEQGAGTVGVAVDKMASSQALSFQQLATAAAAVSGIVAGVSVAVGKLGERGAGVNDVKQSFHALSAAIGESSDAIIGKLRIATQGTISDFELMKTANLGLSQGLSLTADQFGTVGDVAAVLADRTGQDLKTAFETLTQAMATGQDRTLKTIGINIDAAAATKDYADSIHKKVAELTEDQKKQAISNAILAEGQKILALSGKAQEDFGDKVNQSRSKISNFVDSIGSWIATSPKIGAWTSTITAASSSITAVGLAFGPVSAGVSKLIPLIGLSGIGGAFASLGTIITATVIPGLVSAFALLSPFLVPLAALAAAVGAVYLAWRNWDTIAGIAKAVYDGVKMWLVDKFNAVVESIRAKVDAVTGFFKGMYDKVIGNSYVPDMISGIASEFGKLSDVMVKPAQAALDDVAKRFSDSLSGLFGGAEGGTMGRIIGGGMNLIFGPVGGLITSLMSKGLAKMADLAWDGLKKIGGYFKDVFGGPSAKELAGREIVANFEDNIASMMTESQKLQAGNESWKQTVIVVRDAYLKLGKTEAEALDAVNKLWASSKGGADAVAAAMRPIQDALNGVASAADKIPDDPFANWSTPHIPNVEFPNVEVPEGPDLPAFATGTRGKYLNFGSGTPVMLHGFEKVTPMGQDEGGGATTINLVVDGQVLATVVDRSMMKRQRQVQRLNAA